MPSRGHFNLQLLFTALFALLLAASVGGAQEPQQGGTLIVALSGEPTTIDVLSGSLATTGITNLVCEGLIADDVTAVGETFAPLIPKLATDWTMSEDGLVYTFNLREGVTFHDGTPFNADAVVANFERFMNSESPLYDEAGRAVVASKVRRITNYRAVDDYTFEITLDAPWGSFLRNFKHRNFGIISPAALEAAGAGNMDGEFLVCTGPFKYLEREQGVKVVLERNENYWDTASGGPYLDQVVFQTIPDASARIAALQSGQIDIDMEIPADRVADLSQDPSVVVELPGHPHVYYFIPNHKHPALQDLRVRQAIWHAIDVDGMINSLFGETAIPLNSFLPPGNPAYRPGYERLYPFDPARARELLAEAGYDSSQTLNYVFPTSGASYMDSPAIAQWIQSNLRDVGMNVELQPLEWAAWIEALQPGLDENAAFAINGIQSIADDPFFMEQYLHSANFRPAGSNLSSYNNPAADELLTVAAATTDPEQWIEAYHAAEDELLRDVAVIPLAHYKHPRAYRASVHGLEFGPSPWFDLTEVWLEN